MLLFTYNLFIIYVQLPLLYSHNTEYQATTSSTYANVVIIAKILSIITWHDYGIKDLPCSIGGAINLIRKM